MKESFDRWQHRVVFSFPGGGKINLATPFANVHIELWKHTRIRGGNYAAIVWQRGKLSLSRRKTNGNETRSTVETGKNHT